MVLEQTPLGSISYSYDALGRRTSMTVSGQSPVSYQYDAAGRLTGMNAVINGVGQGFSLAYDPLGRRTSLTLPNGIQTTYTYDPASRLQQLLHQKAGNPLENIQYQYDASGNRTNYTRTNPHPPLPQEIQATFNATNQMLNLNDKTYQYDANGNLIGESSPAGTKTYSWDSRNRLVGISGPGLTASFKYDALGRRIEKTINGVTTQYLYDGLDIVAELQNGSVTTTYLRSLNIDEPFSRTKSGTTAYYLQDALGSVVGLTDSTGAIATTYSYDVFGAVTQSGAASDQPFKYTGREDDGTGLFYYRARYYSPEMRRFISEDPLNLTIVILLKQSSLKGVNNRSEKVFKYALIYPQVLNELIYITNNPVNNTDPVGLIPPRGVLPRPCGIGCTIGAAGCATLFGGAGFVLTGSIVGGVFGGIVGGHLCGVAGSTFDAPCDGQLNCNESHPPTPRDPYCDENGGCC